MTRATIVLWQGQNVFRHTINWIYPSFYTTYVYLLLRYPFNITWPCNIPAFQAKSYFLKILLPVTCCFINNDSNYFSIINEAAGQIVLLLIIGQRHKHSNDNQLSMQLIILHCSVILSVSDPGSKKSALIMENVLKFPAEKSRILWIRIDQQH